MSIDWSKAPEGATHWDSRGNACSLGFMKPGLRAGEWEYAGCGGHWVLYGLADSKLLEAMVPRPTPWSGEGLPPVGTVCEVWDGAARIWGKVEVVFISDLTVVVRFPCGNSFAEWARDVREVDFRPIRTHEQIAAEERKEAVSTACVELYGALEQFNLSIDCSMAMRATVEAMIDAGYRKVEGGAA